MPNDYQPQAENLEQQELRKKPKNLQLEDQSPIDQETIAENFDKLDSPLRPVKKSLLNNDLKPDSKNLRSPVPLNS